MSPGVRQTNHYFKITKIQHGRKGCRLTNDKRKRSLILTQQRITTNFSLLIGCPLKNSKSKLTRYRMQKRQTGIPDNKII